MQRVAVVFGGAGFIGRYVVQRLARAEYGIRVASRDPARAREVQTSGRVGQIVPLRADLTDEAAVARAVEGATVAINLVGILAEPRAGGFQATQAEGAGRIARLAAAAGVQRLVHVSAIGADPASDSDYARSKGEGERAVLAAFPGATILRPSIVFGPEDGFFNLFAGMAQWAPVMPVLCGDTRFQPVYVGDVADAVMAALERDDVAGRVFELGGPRALSFRDIIRYILETTGRPGKRLFEVPMGLARLQARVAERIPGKPFTQDQLRLLQRDNVVAEGAAGLEALGITPRAIEAVVPGYLARFRPGGGRRD
jgi:uncharacterized protein YbjT (DUF2867 family)